MRMRTAGIDVQFLKLRAAQRALRHHPFDGLQHHALGMLAFEDLTHAAAFDAARVACMPVEALVLGFVAGQRDFSGVDDDNVVTGVDVRREDRFVLTAQQRCYFHGKATENDVFSVDHEPLLLDLSRFGRIGLHLDSFV